MTPPGPRAPEAGQDIIKQGMPYRFIRGHDTFRPWDTTFLEALQTELGVGAIGSEGDLPFAGQPWVTPIVGSGPLGLPEGFLESCRHLPGAVAHKLLDPDVFEWHDFDAVGADPARWISDFAFTLMVQRVPGSERYERPAPGDASADEIALAEQLAPHAALLVLVAAQLTRTFHRISLDTCRPISRWGSEEARMGHAHDRRLDLKDEYLDLLTSACLETENALRTYAQKQPDLRPTLTSIEAVVSAVRRQAGDNAVQMAQLEQVTEAAWLMVLESVAGMSYPGWTNLLLKLVLREVANTENGIVRPRWRDMEALRDALNGIVLPVAAESWATCNTPARRANRDFYDSLASTLWAQHAVREFVRRPPGAGQDAAEPVIPSRPTAYVSSFDFELEMALWRTAPTTSGSSTYSVVFPVYGVSKASQHLGAFLWLEAVIRVKAGATGADGRRTVEEFNDMHTVSEYRILSPDTVNLNAYQHPVVVRIVGCPLLKLPEELVASITDQLKSAQLDDVERFVHAVTVDEYLAFRQTERDLVWGYRERNRGLPTNYFDGGGSAPWRYWMVLGVPFRDPAIRLRVMSVLARSDTGRSTSSPAKVAGYADQVDLETVPEHPGNGDRPVPVTNAGVAPQDGVHNPGKRAPLTSSAQEFIGRRQAPTSGTGVDSWPPGPVEDPPGDTPDESSSGGDVQDAVDESRTPVPRYGLAVNTRTADEEIMLFNSLGFPVVKDTCESFTEDLESYAAELRAAVGSGAQRGRA